MIRLEDVGTEGVDLTDTHGVSVWDFDLQFDTGSFLGVPDVGTQIYSTLTGLFWGWYRNLVSVQIWVLDWVLGMDWLGFILSPLAGISVIVQSMVSQIGILSLTLIILAFVVGFWLIRGRYAGGFMELLIGCAIAALATGFLANPMATIGGPNGVIMQSRDAGMSIATGFATEGASFEQNTDAIRDGLKGQLVDTLVRTPHQILNYGAMIDGTACEGRYDEHVGQDDAAEQIGSCDPALGEAASSVSEGTVVAAISLLSSAFVFLVLSVVIVGGTIFAVLLLGWSAIKLLWQLPVGVVSSDTRGALFKTFASVAFGCFLVAIATVFLVAWMKMLLGFYGATSGLPFLVRLYLFNTVVIAGAVAYVIAGASVRKGLRTLAERLAKMGASPSKIPAPAKIDWEAPEKFGKNYDKVKGYLGVGLGPKPAPASPGSAVAASTGTAAGALVGGAVSASESVARTAAEPPPWMEAAATARMPGGTHVPEPYTPGERLGRRLRTAGQAAGEVALTAAAAGATAGTSTAVTGSRALVTAGRGARTVRASQRVAGAARSARSLAVRYQVQRARAEAQVRATAEAQRDRAGGY